MFMFRGCFVSFQNFLLFKLRFFAILFPLLFAFQKKIKNDDLKVHNIIKTIIVSSNIVFEIWDLLIKQPLKEN